VIFFVAGLVGLVFGGADQYLGSLFVLGHWASTVSAMSAPWLMLPFAFGASQPRQRPAMLAGLAAVMAALAGYVLMTISPVESVPLSHFPSDLIQLASAQRVNIVGGLVTAPLFGLLGHRWRTERSWASAAALTATFCLEPLARFAVGRLSAPGIVWLVEISLGACLAAYFARAGATYRRRLAA
jgi:Family of unknown function (DUF6518)